MPPDRQARRCTLRLETLVLMSCRRLVGPAPSQDPPPAAVVLLACSNMILALLTAGVLATPAVRVAVLNQTGYATRAASIVTAINAAVSSPRVLD